MRCSFEWYDTNAKVEEQVSFVMRCSLAEAVALLGYDLSSNTSPPAADSRALARPLVEAAQAAATNGTFPESE